MSTLYNRIAGHSIERLAAISDGIFGVAMTLLVLDLRAPVANSIHSEHELWTSIVALAPRLLTYMLSFLTAGIYWVAQQTQLNHLTRSDHRLTWGQIAFLFAVSILPFSTALLAQFIRYRVALLVYYANILVMGAVLLGCWEYALRAGLVKPEALPLVSNAFRRRVLIAQALYGFGFALCVINTYCSITFIVLVQLNYALAPPLSLPRKK
jgi:TMEM175 potassium channel family protein